MPTERHPHTPPPPGPFEYRFAPSVSAIRLARRVVANWLELQPGADPAAVEDLVVVCSELVTNAVRDAEQDGPMVTVRASVDRDRSVILDVETAGAHADAGARALLIVEALTDGLAVIATDAGTIVRCSKRDVLRPRPVPAPEPAKAAPTPDRTGRHTASTSA